MASPQRENGHIDVAHETAEQLCRINLRPYEWRTIWAIFRKTYGWHKKEDQISITQFEALTGLTRRHQHRALKTLIEKNLVISNADSYIITYCFQKDYTKWQGYKPISITKPLPKQVIVNPLKTITQTGNTLLPKQVTKPLPKQVNTKETKETIQKKAALSEDFIKVLKANPAYSHINIDQEFGKIDAWLLTRPRRQKTKRFIVSWLNRIEKPLSISKPRPAQEAYKAPPDSERFKFIPNTSEILKKLS